jgi:hypothetical protein
MPDTFEDVQTVTNTGTAPLKVWFEPWGMPHMLPPGESFRVVCRSNKVGQLEVVEAEGSVAVYAWPGSTLRVFNGEALVDDCSNSVPDLPPGMTLRSFVGALFGGPGGPIREE